MTLLKRGLAGRLSSTTIRRAIAEGLIIIEPDMLARAIQPASLDIRVGNTWVVNEPTNWWEGLKSLIGLPAAYRKLDVCKEEITLNPGDFVLGATYEKITIDPAFAGQISGVSSGGRMGLLIHISAGYVDPGWAGCLTLEFKNEDKLPITLHAGERIGQLVFDWLDQAPETPYGTPELGSRYWGSTKAEEARPARPQEPVLAVDVKEPPVDPAAPVLGPI